MERAVMQNKICPICKRELPVFDAEDRYNFCPSARVVEDQVVDICRKCKIDEIVLLWAE